MPLASRFPPGRGRRERELRTGRRSDRPKRSRPAVLPDLDPSGPAGPAREPPELDPGAGGGDPPGDLRSQFEALVDGERTRALRVAWRLVGGDDAAAEDVMQDAVLRAYRALGRFRGDASLRTWFYRILVHQAHSYMRWRGVRGRWGWHPLPDELRDPAPVAQSDRALRQQIVEAMGRLSQNQREAFVLVHLEGYTVNETAEIMGKASGTVKSHLHRALMSLRKRLEGLS